ncbi:MAG: hypothetical protein ABI425_05690 [Patescibacteria group bacterium]
MKKMKVIIVITIISITAISVLALYTQVQRNKRFSQIQSQVESNESTGAIAEPTPTGALTLSIETAVRPHLPAQLSSATVSFNYKINKIQIDYCGELNVVMDDFKAFLDEKEVDRTFLTEDQLVLNNGGVCQ